MFQLINVRTSLLITVSKQKRPFDYECFGRFLKLKTMSNEGKFLVAVENGDLQKVMELVEGDKALIESIDKVYTIITFHCNNNYNNCHFDIYNYIIVYVYYIVS